MKKIFTVMAAMLLSVSMFAQFGILVNGKTYYAGTENPSPQDPSFREFMVLGLAVNAGDYCQLCDKGSNYATWAVNLDGASVSAIKRAENDNKYTISESGCFDFYIKIKENQDQLYVGAGACGSPVGEDITGGQGGQGGQGGTDEDAYWYWKGYVDGKSLNNEMEGGIFYDGMSEITVNEAGYIFVIYQVHGVQGVQYMTDGWLGFEVTHATMSSCGDCSNGNSLYLPAGTHTLYLYDNGDGTVELSREQLSGKTLVGGGSQAIEYTSVSEKAHKVIIDGQLRIVRGNRVFDATGREL